jgi:hypothetical protein
MVQRRWDKTISSPPPPAQVSPPRQASAFALPQGEAGLVGVSLQAAFKFVAA